MVTAAKTAFNLHIFSHFFLVCEYQVQKSITSSLLIDHLITWFKKLLGIARKLYCLCLAVLAFCKIC